MKLSSQVERLYKKKKAVRISFLTITFNHAECYRSVDFNSLVFTVVLLKHHKLAFPSLNVSQDLLTNILLLKCWYQVHYLENVSDDVK
ncbi:CLUMA_CG012405, isoform A [Clunio marinus]|uniref:CLUMA_CG012405, isoform A n=1 Tax=Clunio marinus TaxID=568069 RepID=A0A1J1IEH6_9DIPT|nr:CLUMA_CG012405, isoform A [Clunio marinus]